MTYMQRKYDTREAARRALFFLRQCLNPEHWPQIHGRKVIVPAESESIKASLQLMKFEEVGT